jgi:hypothetical protein
MTSSHSRAHAKSLTPANSGTFRKGQESSCGERASTGQKTGRQMIRFGIHDQFGHEVSRSPGDLC